MEEEPGSVHLEMPFTLALPAQEVYHKVQGLADSDQVMIQGIIDCWYEKDGQITLIDYKSDLIRGSREQLVQILGERYQSQLGWYKKALEALTGLPVANCHIWHIRRAELVPVSLP
jgi:ATP-dependent helicase/nuclease subunit A